MAILDALSLNPTQAYSRLPDGDESFDPPSPNAKPKIRRSFRCSKERFIFLLIIACILSVLFYPLFHYRETPNLEVQHKWHEELKNNSTGFEPIFGTDNNRFELYFPPVGNDFRPPVAPYNHPPDERPRTPLFIPFTRNNDMLRQAVLGYIAAGWPREDIVIVDNTGTMDANNENLLSRDNPFFIDYPLYRTRYGVSVLQTSTLLNFAQLQNFFLRLAIAEKWPYFFWSHMDVGILSDEAADPYKSFYSRVLDVLDESTSALPNPNITWSYRKDEMRQTSGKWAIKFFEFDNLALVNVDAWRVIGAWDVFVPYYNTDCDAYARVLYHGYTKDEVRAGHIFDIADQVGHTAEELEAAFFPAAQLRLNASQAATQLRQYRAELEAQRNPNNTAEDLFSGRPRVSADPEQHPDAARFRTLLSALQNLAHVKATTERNGWQAAQQGGRGEPWTYDPKGFQTAWWATAGYGRDLYTKKWGTMECYLNNHGVPFTDMWKSEYPEEHMPAPPPPPPPPLPPSPPQKVEPEPQEPEPQVGPGKSVEVRPPVGQGLQQEKGEEEKGEEEQEKETEEEKQRVEHEMERVKALEKELTDAQEESEESNSEVLGWMDDNDGEREDDDELWGPERRSRRLKRSVGSGEKKARRGLRKRWVQRASSGEWYLG